MAALAFALSPEWLTALVLCMLLTWLLGLWSLVWPWLERAGLVRSRAPITGGPVPAAENTQCPCGTCGAYKARLGWIVCDECGMAAPATAEEISGRALNPGHHVYRGPRRCTYGGPRSTSGGKRGSGESESAS